MAYNIELNGLQIKNAEGKNVIGSDFKVEIKELDTYKRTFWAIASDEAPDRDKDIIRVEGWNLKNYTKSPRGLWMHNYFEHPHFKTLKTKIDKDSKQFRFQPQFDTHDRALMTWNQFANGFLDDFSVGFIPGQFDYVNPDDKWSGGRDFTKGHELLEISAVTVPANPNAQILRSAGLIPEDQISLLTLGFKNEFSFNVEKNAHWYPIFLNMEAYKNPKTIKLGKGISVVKAFPRFDVEKELVVGYYFDREDFNSDKSIAEWISKQLLVIPTVKYYKIGFNEEKSELDINVIDQETPIKVESVFEFDDEIIEDDKTLSTSDVPENLLEQNGKKPKPDDMMCSCETFEASEDNAEKCKGCGGKKPKAADPKEPDEDDKSSLNDKMLKNIMQIFDKQYKDIVNSKLTELDFVKSELAEVKGLLLELLKTKTDLELSSDDQLLDLSELDLSKVSSPVSVDKDDSSIIQIDPEIFNRVSKDAVIDAIRETFQKVFETEKNKLSGKLDD